MIKISSAIYQQNTHPKQTTAKSTTQVVRGFQFVVLG